MKCRLVLLITALVLIMVPLLVKADSELPLDGESWLNKSLSDAAAILQNAGYTKSDEKTEGDYILYLRSDSPENVYLTYNKQTLETVSINMVFYKGADFARKIVESYSLIYGEPIITNNKNEEYLWNNNGYHFRVSFATNYDDAKTGSVPFSLQIASQKSSGNTEKEDEDNSTEAVPTAAEELRLGGTIDLPFVEMTFSRVQRLNELKFSEKETGSLAHSLNKNLPNSKYIAIRGKIKNKSKQPFDLNNGLRGKAYFDGYEYDIGFFSVSFEIEPLLESPFYLYALIPEDLASSFEECEFRFGFNDDFQTDYIAYDESIQYDHKYQITITQ